MKPDVAHALLRAASRPISTPALFCFISTLAAQTVSSNWAETDVVYIMRIAYANARFTSGMPGWKTDRGRIYIKYGPPDEIESYPAASYQRPLEQGGGTTSMYPFEQWRYRYLKDIGTDVVFEFVDRTNTGEYRLIIDPTDKEALANLRGNLPPQENIGARALIIGDIQMRSRRGAIFADNEKLGFYIQLYHFALDPVSHKPNGSIEYQVVNNYSQQTVLSYTEEVSDLPGATSQVVVEKLLPLISLTPGSYTLKLRVTDRNRNQTITPSADFTILPAAPR